MSRTAAATAARQAKRAERPLPAGLGGRILALREAQGLTQQQLADQCGLTKAAISRLETGLSAGRVATLATVADQLGVTVADLLS